MKNKFDIVALENWYIENHRKLPFRETRNPYHIWVSEIMAQQTQMDTVVTYFERFIKKYPSVFDLAASDSDSLHKMVEGIGYYRRFQHMHEAAKFIVDTYNGEFPSTIEDVRNLPGVGDYTLGAIMSIAYNQPIPATDGNVVRVLSRFFGIDTDMRLPKSRKQIDDLNRDLIKNATPYIYTQALMELGALVCHKQKPTCEACPLKENCKAYNENLTAKLPVISSLKKVKTVRFTTIILKYKNQVALVKKEHGLLKGMYLYPQFESTTIEDVVKWLNESKYMVKETKALKNCKHVFTHAIWLMEVYEITLDSLPDNSSYVFYEDVSMLPMATAHKKIK